MGNVEVLSGAVLTIPAGVKIEFQDFYSLQIQGAIQALGEADNKIRFTSSQPELYDINHSSDGAWNGIHFSNTSYSTQSSILQYCIFEYSKNIEVNGVGAAISCFDFSKLRIANCLFQNNAADYGGAIGLEFNSNPIIVSNIFSANSAFLGGSTIYCTYSYPRIINNTIVENQVLNDDIFVSTGAIHTFQSKPQLYNNIIWGNSDNFFEDSPLLFCKLFYVGYNNIELGFEGNGNIDLDPLFDPTIPNSLTSNSPCIDAGLVDMPFDLQLPEFDFVGNNRISGNFIDMGAIEWQNTSANDEIVIKDCELTNFPNPFNPSTIISFSLNTKVNEKTELIIYNLKGQKIKDLSPSLCHTESGEVRGELSVTWNGTNDSDQPVATGIYLAKVKAGNQILTRKMLLMK